MSPLFVAWVGLCFLVGILLWIPLGPAGAGAVSIALFVAGAMLAQRRRSAKP